MKYFKLLAHLISSKGIMKYGFALREGHNGLINLPEAMKYFRMSADS
jgi:hypothetical protein